MTAQNLAVACVLIVILSVQPAIGTDPAEKDKRELQGTWILISSEHRGKQLETDERMLAKGAWKLVIAGEKLIYRLDDGRVRLDKLELTFTLNPTQKPKWIDTTRLVDGERLTARGIYELKEDVLKWCIPGVEKERPTDFKTRPDKDWILRTFKRQKVSTPKELEGTWALESATMRLNGKALAGDAVKGLRIIFAREKVFFDKDGQKREAKWEVGRDNNPRAIDFFESAQDGRESNRHVGIYSLEKNELKLCLVVDDDRPEEFEVRETDRNRVLLILKRLPEKPDK